MSSFDYFTAFQRNLGFITKPEQEQLRNSRVAIAGLGGTGGSQVHALTRIGIGAFTLSDPDFFELANFNRQIGARMDTIGRDKADVAKEIVNEINPDADVKLIKDGISPETIDEFLLDADIVVDSLDFYCFKERFLLYKKAREKGLWVITSPPLGFGFTLLAFSPNGMSFTDYFGFNESMPEEELAVSLIAGIAPKPLMFKYLQRDGIDIKNSRLPSVGAAPFMIAGVMASEVTNKLLHKSRLIKVPTILQYDAILHRFVKKTYPMGMKSPLQKLKIMILKKKMLSS